MVQITGQVTRAQAAYRHQQHGAHWQSDQDADESKNLTKRQQGKNNSQGMQANTLADQARRQEKTLHQLAQTKTTATINSA